MLRSVSTNKTLRCVKLLCCTSISMFIITIVIYELRFLSRTLVLSVVRNLSNM
jgi:hypothetical protein